MNTQRPHIQKVKPTYYYIVAEVQGRHFTDGAYMTEEEAREVGFRTLQVDFVVVASKCGSLKEFNREERHNVLVETADPVATFKNFRHTA